MSKKVVFNHETLSFETISTKILIKDWLVKYSLALIIGVISGFLLFKFANTPEANRLEKQKDVYIASLNELNRNIDRQLSRMRVLENTDDYSYRMVLGLEPVSASTRLFGYGGSRKFSNYDFIENGKLLKEIASKNFFLSNRIKYEAHSYSDLILYVRDLNRRMSNIPSFTPLRNKDLKRIGSGFGYRMHPILHVIKMHTGVDLVADRGKPVYAAGDGLVVRADAAARGYGNCVRIDHGYSYQTMYAHLSKILVVPGQFVKRGQLIGLVGSTGRSTGPHLHFEVRINNTPVNPMNFILNDLDEQQYEMLLRQASAAVDEK